VFDFPCYKRIEIKTTLRFHFTQLEWPSSKTKPQQMLARMWGNRNPYTLLVGMEISTTIMESSMEIPQKAKSRTAI
jgi:hypothetical protein